MKSLKYIIIFSLLLTACEYDNYEPPKSKLTGKIVYEGTPVGVKHNINVLQIYEPGWQNFDPITVHVDQDGTFSSLLFDGDYKLVLIKGNGPWVDQTDTIDIEVRGGETLDLPVQPFFWVDNETFQIDGTTLTATFNLKKLVEGKNLQFVSLFIGETMLVDNRYKTREERLPAGAVGDLSEPITLSMDLANIEEDYIFARVGVKTQGNPELVFTQVQKIEL